MNKLPSGLMFSVALLIMSACTRIPVEYSEATARPASTADRADISDVELLSIVSNARVGATLTHVDPVTGLASTVRVNSEYFSANGRSCRRFTQRFSNSATSEGKLACRARDGWRQIPIASIVE